MGGADLGRDAFVDALPLPAPAFGHVDTVRNEDVDDVLSAEGKPLVALNVLAAIRLLGGSGLRFVLLDRINQVGPTVGCRRFRLPSQFHSRR